MQINIYDDMNNLISNLHKTEVVVEFKKLNKELRKEENKEYLEKIEKFQALNYELNQLEMLGEESENKTQIEEESKAIYEDLTRNELTLRYLEKEIELTNLISHLNGIFVSEISKIYQVEEEEK